MVNFKKIIAEKIAKVAELNIEEIESYIEYHQIKKWEIMHFLVLNLQKH